MKVAVLVHNNVMQDPRIHKEVRSLEKKNYTVSIFGLTHKNIIVKSDLKANIILARSYSRVIIKLFEFVKFFILVTISLFILELVFRVLGIHTFIWLLAGVYTSIVLIQFARFILEIKRTLEIEPRTDQGFGRFTQILKPIKILATWFKSTFGRLRPAFEPFKPVLDWFRSIKRKFKNPLQFYQDYLYSSLGYFYLSELIYKKAIKHGKCDIIHCHDIIALRAAIKLKKKWNVPLIWDAHEFYTKLGYIKADRKKLHDDYIKRAVKHIDHFITISDHFGDYYCRTYPLPKAHIVMNASEMMGPIDYDGRLHEAAKIPLSNKILLYQGVYGPKRGLTQLLDSMALVDKQYHLVFMGWGGEEENLRAHAKKINNQFPASERRITFIPPSPHKELPLWTSGAHLGIIPYENSSINHLYVVPNKLWEYPIVGVPIVSSSLVELEKIISEHGTGFLFPREFVAQDIATCINDITDEQWQKARENCETFKLTQNWSKYEPELYEVYDQIEVVT